MIRYIGYGAAALFLLALSTFPAVAQDYEKQAAEILKLYEAGQKDTAYTLVEPLKQNARFVPAALYVRAQMTPDDRALNLYREIIALEPTGAWADEATYQLVRRYIDKKDSTAAWTWFNVLQKSHAQSPYIASAKSLLNEVEKWELEMPEMEDGKDIASTPATSAPPKSTSAKPSGTTAGASGKGTGSTAAANSPAATTSGAATKSTPASTATEFSGYALQVGLFPTKAAAEKRTKELEAGPLRPKIFPKEVNGKTQYALVVGPYKSLDDANKAKPAVAKACDCGAFTVKVD